MALGGTRRDRPCRPPRRWWRGPMGRRYPSPARLAGSMDDPIPRAAALFRVGRPRHVHTFVKSRFSSDKSRRPTPASFRSGLVPRGAEAGFFSTPPRDECQYGPAAGRRRAPGSGDAVPHVRPPGQRPARRRSRRPRGSHQQLRPWLNSHIFVSHADTDVWIYPAAFAADEPLPQSPARRRSAVRRTCLPPAKLRVSEEIPELDPRERTPARAGACSKDPMTPVAPMCHDCVREAALEASHNPTSCYRRLRGRTRGRRHLSWPRARSASPAP